MVMRCCVNFPMMKFSNLKKKTMMKNKKDRFTILSGISGIAFLFLIIGVAIPSSAFSGSNSSTSYLVHIPVVSYLPGRGGIPSTATTLVSHSYSSSLFSSDKVVVLAGNQSGAEDMAVSGGYVYWYDFGSGQLNRVSESGGPVTTLLTVANYNHAAVYGLDVSTGFVYWGLGNFSSNTSYLYKTNGTTGTTKILYSASGIFGAVGVTVAGKHVYFISNSNIDKVKVDGTGFQVLASAPSPFPWMLAYSNGFVFWYDLSFGYVGKVPASGGAPVILSPQLGNSGTGYNGVRNLIVVGGEVYWTHNNDNNNNRSLFAVTTSGSNFTSLYSIISGASLFAGVSYFKGNVIFAGPNDIYSIPATGGAPTSIVKISAYSVEVFKKHVYFTAGNEVGKARA